jgi:hypothetical protein
MPDLAPIALFVFKRPEHTRRTLEALARNPEFADSPLHVFCDGSRRPGDDAAVLATREVVRNWAHPRKAIHAAPGNRGLAASIIEGVSRLCASYGRVIVVEDDLVVAPVFLDFLNRALDRYSDEPQVMQVSGHMFPVDLAVGHPDAVFMPFITSWGWATWHRAWQCFDSTAAEFERLSKDRALRRRFDLDDCYPYFRMLKKQKAGLIDSWAIRWYLSVFMRNGLVLYPSRSLVSNEGFDGTGTHCGSEDNMSDKTAAAMDRRLLDLPRAELNHAAFLVVRAFLASQTTIWQRVRRRLMKRVP